MMCVFTPMSKYNLLFLLLVHIVCKIFRSPLHQTTMPKRTPKSAKKHIHNPSQGSTSRPESTTVSPMQERPPAPQKRHKKAHRNSTPQHKPHSRHAPQEPPTTEAPTSSDPPDKKPAPDPVPNPPQKHYNAPAQRLRELRHLYRYPHGAHASFLDDYRAVEGNRVTVTVTATVLAAVLATVRANYGLGDALRADEVVVRREVRDCAVGEEGEGGGEGEEWVVLDLAGRCGWDEGVLEGLGLEGLGLEGLGMAVLECEMEAHAERLVAEPVQWRAVDWSASFVTTEGWRREKLLKRREKILERRWKRAVAKRMARKEGWHGERRRSSSLPPVLRQQKGAQVVNNSGSDFRVRAASIS